MGINNLISGIRRGMKTLRSNLSRGRYERNLMTLREREHQDFTDINERKIETTHGIEKFCEYKLDGLSIYLGHIKDSDDRVIRQNEFADDYSQLVADMNEDAIDQAWELISGSFKRTRDEERYFNILKNDYETTNSIGRFVTDSRDLRERYSLRQLRTHG
ncbi:MAG: hypothetical protein ACLFPQ_01875 [Candidatus Woesearchaeota archaeon]